MAVFSSLRAIIRKSRNADPKAFLALHHAAATPFASHFPLVASDFRLTSSHSRILCKSTISFPISGRLFLSYPAYKLSQSATPLYWGGRFGFRKSPSPRFLEQGKFMFGTGLRNDTGGKYVSEQKALRGVGAASAVDVTAEAEGIWNWPNLISISRLFSGPFLGWMIVNEWYLPAFVGLAISGASDWLDGFVARKMGINSVLGSYLDPLADKVLVGCVAVAMVEKDLLHPGLVALVVVRDVALVGGAIYRRAVNLRWEWKSWSDFVNLNATQPEKVEPLFISKVNTVFQLVLVASALLQPEFGTEETQAYVTYLSWLVASTTLASSVAYGMQYARKGVALVSWRSASNGKS